MEVDKPVFEFLCHTLSWPLRHLQWESMCLVPVRHGEGSGVRSPSLSKIERKGESDGGD